MINIHNTFINTTYNVGINISRSKHSKHNIFKKKNVFVLHLMIYAKLPIQEYTIPIQYTELLCKH